MGGDAKGPKRSGRRVSFNPRPRVGGDPRFQRSSPQTRSCFNPRPRVGGDADEQLHLQPLGVSIHAPAWEATAKAAALRLSRKFQSTPPRGRRRTSQPAAARRPGFNPRPRVGGDLVAVKLATAPQSVSIHAPAWEATDVEDEFYTLREFQSTPPRGRRRLTYKRDTTGNAFQSTPPRGRRRGALLGQHLMDRQVSIHAPAWEATFAQLITHHYSTVSIHAPAWEATRVGDGIRRRLLFQSTPPRGRRHLPPR